MTPEEKFNREMWWVLKQLKYVKISKSPNEDVTKIILPARPIIPEGTPSIDAQQRAIYKIEELGGIKVLDERIEIVTYGKNFIYKIHFLPKFDEVYKEYEQKCEYGKIDYRQERADTKNQQGIQKNEITGMPEVKVSGFQTSLIAKNKGCNPLVLNLNNVGDLYREPKKRYCYSMGEKSDRHAIVRYLATHNGYQMTSIISLALENKSTQSIRTEIAKIRKNIKKYLKVEGEKIIGKGKKGSGYRIEQNCKIKILS